MPEANFIEHQKKQKKLVIVLLVLLALMAVIIYFGILRPSSPSSAGIYNIQKPDINFNLDILTDPVLNALTPFIEIQPINPLDATSVPEEIGRENPFLPF